MSHFWAVSMPLACEFCSVILLVSVPVIISHQQFCHLSPFHFAYVTDSMVHCMSLVGIFPLQGFSTVGLIEIKNNGRYQERKATQPTSSFHAGFLLHPDQTEILNCWFLWNKKTTVEALLATTLVSDQL